MKRAKHLRSHNDTQDPAISMTIQGFNIDTLGSDTVLLMLYAVSRQRMLRENTSDSRTNFIRQMLYLKQAINPKIRKLAEQWSRSTDVRKITTIEYRLAIIGGLLVADEQVLNRLRIRNVLNDFRFEPMQLEVAKLPA